MAVAAEGITLTAASHVIFAELDWTPGRVAQAEDRAHRIGQHDSVLVEHVVVDGSIDARIAQVLLEKAQVAATVLGDTPATETPEPDVLAAGLEFGDEDEELEMLLATDDALVA
jgi:SWI/SNF-related matrix-associated actin-dependent regulator 1 of chromatin subfamily A